MRHLPVASAVLVAVTWCAAAVSARAAEVDVSKLPPAPRGAVDFAKQVRPIFEKACFGCHGAEKQKSGYRLDSRPHALKGGDLGVVPIVPGDSARSPLIHYVSGLHDEVTMPPKGDLLTAEEVGVLRAWIDQGAKWPADAAAAKVVDKADWWSFKPIVRPPLPPVAAGDRARVRNPIDAFVLSKAREKGLTPSDQADRRTLVRRVYFDLTGLPPSPEEVAEFLGNADPNAYEKLVDRLLTSPRYGERWGRHWLDAAHYGDTHGFDKDKVRENAWPYRDYVIRALNDDRPYGRFVREQIAGDQFYPDSPDAIPALGFLAAGPWDFVGHVELREGTIDKAITRNLDRDDMVSVVMNTFTSLTAQCARCHNHKFDAIAQEDYYALQAVFAGIDRADRAYEPDPDAARRRRDLQKRLAELNATTAELEKRIATAGGAELADVDARLAAVSTRPRTRGGGAATTGERPEFGYHSQIVPRQETPKWVQVDLGASTIIDRVVLNPCHDDFAGIGAGFGFPVRYKVEACDDASFANGVTVVADFTREDVPNPGVRPQVLAGRGAKGRYVRVTATKLAPRQGDYIFALGELSVQTPDGRNAARGKPVTALDSIEAPVRWRASNLVDGYSYGMKSSPAADAAQVAELTAKREAIIAKVVDAPTRESLQKVRRDLERASAELKALPPAPRVYAAATEFAAQGAFTATRGKPRPIHLLHRGSEKQPKHEVGPGTIALPDAPELGARFTVSGGGPESRRRAALAEWITHPKNPLTWRSIVNRVWQHHFGRGIVETPNDFRHMGALPTHPELLDWLAAEFRDGGPAMSAQSLKGLHRLIVTSATYRQSSDNGADNAKIDAANAYLWRANRTRLDAETLRDGVLAVAGKLDLRMGGPPFRNFGFKDDHSPHYAYGDYDPDDAATHRRSIYRLVVRSVPDPFMETLDCADPSQIVPRRNETLSPLQALALLNNRFMVRMAERFGERVKSMAADVEGQVDAACRLAYGRGATDIERRTLGEVARKYGLPNACRVILNSNEFLFVD